MLPQLCPIPEIHLHPGEVFCSPQKTNIKTLLGSCIAVCLWDKKHRIGGMNHIMLPLCREDNSPSTRYANVATFVLLDLMLKHGAERKKITARVFGGACGMSRQTNASPSVGDRNIEVTLRVLKKLEIPVVASDIGGNQGRKIFFDPFSGQIRMTLIRNYSFRVEAAQMIRGERRNEVW